MAIQEHQAFYKSIEILPTRGRVVLNAVKCAILLSQRNFNRGLGLWRIVDLGSRLYPNWAECPVVGPDAKRLLVDLRGRGFGVITQGYGVSEITPLIELFDEEAIVLDVGANIGIWTRLFAERVRRGRVYAFEPSPSTFNLLLKNCSEYVNISCIPIALGGESGIAGLREDAEPGLRHIVSSANDAAGLTRVPIRTLDDWVSETGLFQLDFIKIDIEGLEEELLDGARNTIQRLKPAILFEFIPAFAEQRSKFKGRMIFGLLRESGYRIYRLDKSGFLHEDFVKPEDWTNDYVSIPENSRFQAEVAKLLR